MTTIALKALTMHFLESFCLNRKGNHMLYSDASTFLDSSAKHLSLMVCLKKFAKVAEKNTAY